MAYTYQAFISCIQEDEKTADWLSKTLAKYKVPKELVGQQADTGEMIAKHLDEVFYEGPEASERWDLPPRTIKVLKVSRTLIVVCSRESAKSNLINEQVRMFKTTHKENRIFCVVVDGQPLSSEGGNTSQECIPECVLYKLTSRGTLSQETADVYFADLRSGKKELLKHLVPFILGAAHDVRPVSLPGSVTSSSFVRDPDIEERKPVTEVPEEPTSYSTEEPAAQTASDESAPPPQPKDEVPPAPAEPEPEEVSEPEPEPEPAPAAAEPIPPRKEPEPAPSHGSRSGESRARLEEETLSMPPRPPVRAAASSIHADHWSPAAARSGGPSMGLLLTFAVLALIAIGALGTALFFVNKKAGDQAYRNDDMLGRFEEAKADLRAARQELGLEKFRLSMAWWDAGRAADAMDLMKQAVALHEDLLKTDPYNHEYKAAGKRSTDELARMEAEFPSTPEGRALASKQAEQARLEAQQKAEQARLEAEQKAEQARLEAERQARERAEREAREKAEQEARERAEREAKEREQNTPRPATDIDALVSAEGKVRTVEGIVKDVEFYRGRELLVNFQGTQFYCVTADLDLKARLDSQYNGSFADALAGKKIQVKGPISLYRGLPQIELTSPDQVKVLR